MTQKEDQAIERLREVTLALRKTLNQRDTLLNEKNEPIAIVGIGCRFPGGANSPAAFWKLLDEGQDAVRSCDERWALVGEKPSDGVPRWCGLLTEKVADFDPAFFGISPREAKSLDPQQRLFLEVAWEAFEDAGIPIGSLEGSRTGVFTGAITTDYAQHIQKQAPETWDAYSSTGNMLSVLAGRLSYTLGLQGACLTVDTACSSSLVAVHLAIQSLRSRESDVALAGGICLLLSPASFEVFSRTQSLSPDGRCKTFDALANGFVRGEGCGLVVLKRLSDAQRDGDRIWALLRGSATNQDGKSTGLTAPNVLSQQALLREAIQNARITPADIGFVETHGTGTALGDPIEVEALRAVLGAPRPDQHPCVLGAVKTNLGHLEAAAGVAGLIKAVLALDHERIPQNLHFQALNPRLRLDGTSLVLATEPRPWPRGKRKRFAGVSAFGISGTNAHVVLEEAPVREAAPAVPVRAAELVLLSAKSEAALNAQAARLGAHLDSHPDLALGDLAYSLLKTRSALEHRLAVAASDRESLKETLREAAAGNTPEGSWRGRSDGAGRPRVYFVFPGQGSQWLGMGRQLVAEEPAFRAVLDACDKAIHKEAGWSLLAELTADEATSQLGRIDVVQPVLFAIEVALAALWRSWGVEPDGVVGHSMGETAAAHVAGALSLEDAVKVICRRSRLLRRISGQGEMALVELPVAEADAALRGYEDRLSVAVSNSPRSTVLSGDPAALAEVLAALGAKGVFCRRVKVDVASHSPQVEPLRADLLAALSDLRPSSAAVPMYSTVTGSQVEGPELLSGYWIDNLRQPVRFADTVQKLFATGTCLFVEMSPHPLLTTAVEEIRQATDQRGVAVGSLRRNRDERRSLLEALGALWTQGDALDAGRLFPAAARRVPLPSYPWQRERYWVETAQPAPSRSGAATGHPLLGVRVPAAGAGAVFESVVGLQSHPWLADRRIGGLAIMPGAGIAEIVRAAAERYGDASSIQATGQATGLTLQAPLVIPESGALRIQAVLAETGEALTAAVYSQPSEGRPDSPWTLHATASLTPEPGPGAAAVADLAAARARCAAALDPSEVYVRLAALGVDYGPAFRGLRALWRGPGEALAELALPDGVDREGYGVHPALCDAALQALEAVVPALTAEQTLFPFEIGQFVVHEPGAEVAWALVRLREGTGVTVDVTLADATGAVVAQMSELRLRPVDPAALREMQAAAPGPASSVTGQAAAPRAETVRTLPGEPARKKPARARAEGEWAARLALLPPERRAEEVRRAVQSDVARVLALRSASATPLDRPLRELGMDSIMAVQLRDLLAARAGKRLSATLAFDHPTVEALVRWLLEEVLVVAETAPKRAPDAPRASQDEPIAIVGMSCRFPGGAVDPESFWQLLAEGRDGITEVPPERWDVDAYYDPDPSTPWKMVTRWGGFLADIEKFEPEFFDMSPREAIWADPQGRLMLEVAWEALERAGQTRERLMGSDTGVYMGLVGTEYQMRAMSTTDAPEPYALLGTMHSAIVGRLSYFLGANGPNVAVDTACSSSLVAVQLACRALRSGECKLALAGGTNVLLSPKTTSYLSHMGAMSPTGRCHAFAAAADGYVRGEGCGVVVLKRLSDAERDGDRILAVIRGAAINQDGRSNGPTAPSGPAQEDVIRRALAQADLSPAAVDFVECHGTGTTLGDPIEVQALGAVYGEARPAGRPVVLGAVKSNIGHVEGAAGVAGLIKAVLALQNGLIPKSLHFVEPNPHINWSELNVTVAAEPVPWPRNGSPRRAGVSSFGVSGTNAHIVLEEAPLRETPTAAPARAAELLVLSARSEAALHAQAARLGEHLEAHPDLALGDLAYSLLTTRSALEYRVSIAASERAGLMDALREVAAGQSPEGTWRGRGSSSGRPRVYFVFPGQGSQWLGMGRQLLAEEPAFRAALEACDKAIHAEAGWSVLTELLADEATSRLGRIDIVQPVLFAIEVALAAMWRAWGVKPDGVLGHSMGETAAAYVAGALTLEHAVQVICRRSLLLRRISGQGEMAVVELTATEAEAALRGYEDRLSVAVSNSPRSTVLSGDPVALAEVLAALETRGVFCRRVKVDVASHSPQVEPLRAELLAALSEVQGQAAAVPMYSTVTGAQVEGPQLRAGYWMENLRQPVRFADTVQALLADGSCLFVEMSPHPLLTTAVEEVRQAAGQKGLAVGSLRRSRPERRSLVEALGALWTQGLALDPSRLFPAGGQRVDLPSYAWQRERYWIETPAEDALRTPGRAHTGHPLLGEGRTVSTQSGTRVWETTLDLSRLPWLTDHRVRNDVVLPGAGYLEMALSAGREALSGDAVVVTGVEIVEALLIPGDTAVAVQVVTTESPPGQLRFQVVSRTPGAAQDAWTVHARGTLRREQTPEPAPPLDLDEVCARLGEVVPSAAVYAQIETRNIQYGPAFRGLVELWRGDEEALGSVRLPEAAGRAENYQIHPALLDACFHTLAGIRAGEGESTLMPVGVGELRLYQPPRGQVYCHARLSREAGASGLRYRADLRIVDLAGEKVAEIRGLVMQDVSSDTRRRKEDDWLFGMSWEAVPPAGTAEPEPARWLLIGEGDGLGVTLRAALAARGHAVAHAVHGAPGEVPPGCLPLDDASVSGVRALLAGSFGGAAPSAVVHLGSLTGARDVDLDVILSAQEQGYDSVLSTVQAVVGMEYREPPRLWIVTRGAHAAGNAVIAVEQAPLVGLGRTIALEHPELRCRRVDLDPAASDVAARSLLAELLTEDAEPEIALRGGARLAPRIVHALPADAPRERVEPAGDRAFYLTIDKPGVLDDLLLREKKRRTPGPGEVEIAVEAAGLNFADVLQAMGLRPDLKSDAPEMGSELAGRITAVGEGVTHVRPGDEVMALSSGAFSSHVCTDAGWVSRRPTGMSAAQAGSVLSVFTTAWYSLAHLARLQAGERILIHSATGGTGLAAIQIARHFGAEVLATAGSPEKRAWLREQGIRHVFDSRSVAFAAQVLEATSGQGVDVVLNSLSGDAIEASLSTLAVDGRFIELGKTDIYSDRPLGLAPFRKSLSYSAVDLVGLASRRPERLRAVQREVLALFEQGTLTPSPVEIFPCAHAAEAFRKMAQGRHIGKLVLRFDDPDAAIHVPVKPRTALHRDGTYLVTGGLGGLGLSVAGWLADKGAGHLVLLGRSGAASEAQKAAVASLEARGARVTVARADVAVREQLQGILTEIAASAMPLRGIVHTAGVLDDGVLTQQTPARFRTVMAPKVLGAWHLHALTRDLPLDFFVLYASMSGLFGSMGQGNYAASNTFLDALAHYRRARGLPALSIDWGAFSEVGLIAAQDRRIANVTSMGASYMTPEAVLPALERLIDGESVQAPVSPLDVQQLLQTAASSASSPLLARLLSDLRTSRAERSGAQGQLLDRLAQTGAADRAELLRGFVRAEVSRVLRIAESKLDDATSLISLGLDSLMGLELRQRMKRGANIDVSTARLLRDMTIDDLIQVALDGLGAPPPASLEPQDSDAWTDTQI